MSGVVLLDTGPLGLVTNPRGSKETENCGRWLQQVVTDGATVMVPEIADYELRRELLRAKKTKGIARLDKLIAQVGYLPITTKAMRQAATYWADARQQGQATADNSELDGDVILAAQAATLNRTDVIIATTNVKHLSRFVQAKIWSDIAV